MDEEAQVNNNDNNNNNLKGLKGALFQLDCNGLFWSLWC